MESNFFLIRTIVTRANFAIANVSMTVVPRSNFREFSLCATHSTVPSKKIWVRAFLVVVVVVGLGLGADFTFPNNNKNYPLIFHRKESTWGLKFGTQT